MKKILLVITLLLSSLTVNANVKDTAGKLFEEAVSGMQQTTPDLKMKVLQKGVNDISANYDNVSPMAKIFIVVSDALQVSITFTMALFWIIGFAMFIGSLIFLKNAMEDNGDPNGKRYQKRFAQGGLVVATMLMAFNIVVLALGDTFGIGSYTNTNYDFQNSTQHTQSFIGSGKPTAPVNGKVLQLGE